MVVDEFMHVVWLLMNLCMLFGFDKTNPFNYDDEPISLDNKTNSSNQVDSSKKVKDQVNEPQDEEKALPQFHP